MPCGASLATRLNSASRTTRLDFVRNVRLGEDERFARHKHDALIRSAAGRRRQAVGGRFRDVYADDGEITGGEFKNVGAAVERHGLRAVGVRIRAEAAEKFKPPPRTWSWKRPP